MKNATVASEMATGWAEAYQLYQEIGIELTYPSETLVRLLKGDYLTGKREDVKGKSILDVGFGGGNNLLLFLSLGMKVSGIEIHQDICSQVDKNLHRVGLEADLKVGTNQEIPYPDNTFDYLVSWNVLHYEGSEKGVMAGIEEYARVLKPGGRILFSTTGPNHRILENGKTLGNHLYEVRPEDDFRAGQVHFFFDRANYLELYFSPFFDDLQVGRIEDDLFQHKLDWHLLTGLRK